ncbi:MAG: AMP-binding protein [Verrucomicrobia bacterium]|nr:AMP-binding protein [Verrucomicrobiota bacterium]
MLVHEFLERAARRFPDKVALVCEDERVTYVEIENRANRLANWLIAQGVRRGDRVGIFLGNEVNAVVGFFAVLKAGGVFVLINPGTKGPKLAYILRDCGAVGLITSHRLFAPLADAVGAVELLKFLVTCDAPGSARLEWRGAVTPLSAIQAEAPAPPPAVPCLDVDLACLIYTSGTTGEPKGVICAHENIVFVTRSIVDYLGNNESDVVLSVLALSFTYGLYQVFAAFFTGATVVLESSFAFPVTILQRMERERVTGFPGVPTIYAVLLRMDLKPFDLASLRFLTNAAAPLAPEAVVEISRRFPQARFFSMYGQTETARTLYLPPEWIGRKPGSVGIAIPGTEVWVEDEHGRRAGPGVPGELIVRGRHVMRGYWNAPAASAARFAPGPWPGERVCRTGDLFRADAEGFLYFVSRSDDIIKCKGEKVAPREVEITLLRLPGVIHAAVVGVPDPVFGQAVKAVLVAGNPAPTAAQVLAHCRANLEDHMIPKIVEFRAELPMTPNGKVKRSELV